MAGAVEPAGHVWNTWGIHVLVLMSFVLQVTLLISAEVRQRKKSFVLSCVVWSAYMLADTTAVYTLGHFFVNGRSSEHELVALWAPLLLVHLGGQDNITAYSIEDNRLWLRHLQTFGLQIAGAAYVLYQFSIFSCPTWLCVSTILMFVVGVLKYGERILALNRANSVHSSELLWLDGSTFEGLQQDDVVKMSQAIQRHFLQMYSVFYSKAVVMCTWHGVCIRVFSPLATITAFLLFHGFWDKQGYNGVDVGATYILLAGAVLLEIASVLRLIFATSKLRWRWSMMLRRQLISLGEPVYASLQKPGIQSASMGQLDLFHLYNRTRESRRCKIVRCMGWWGRWIRLDFSWSIMLPTDTIQTLIELPGKGVHQDSWMQDSLIRRFGVALEEFIRQLHLEENKCWKKEEIVRELMILVMDIVDGIFSVSFMCMRLEREISSFIDRMRLEENRNWDGAEIGRQLMKIVMCRLEEPEGRFLGIRGLGFEDKIKTLVRGDRLEETILVWHIATHLYLKWYRTQRAVVVGEDLVNATEALSNYMIFLLAAHPLPPTGSVSNRACSLQDIASKFKHIPVVDRLFSYIRDRLDNKRPPLIHALSNDTCGHLSTEDTRMLVPVYRTFIDALAMAEELIRKGLTDEMFRAIAHLWVHMLNMVEARLGEDFHIKQLTNGGEFLSMLSILLKYKPPTSVLVEEA